MAGRPRSEWSDAYRRRIERAEAKGKTRQQARGKRAGEHIIRRQREAQRKEMLGELTSADRAYARKIGREFARKNWSDDEDEVAEAVEVALEAMRRIGRVKFNAEVAMQRRLARNYKRDGVAGKVGMAFLEDLVRDDGFPDVHWYFYHNG